MKNQCVRRIHWKKLVIEFETRTNAETLALRANGKDGFKSYPNLLTEEELIRFLRIPEISKSKNHHNVITHLSQHHNLARIRICHQPLYPRQAVLRWIEETTLKEMTK